MTDNFSKRVVATLKDLRSSIPPGTFYSTTPPLNPEVGSLWIDSDYNVPEISFYQRWTKTLSGTQSSFSGDSAGIILEYTPGLESVFLNGALLVRTVDYAATDGSTVVLTVAGQSGDVIEIISPNTLDIANVYDKTEIDSLLSLKSNLNSPTFTGIPLAPTAASGTNTTQIATTAFVRTEVANLIASAPTALDTLDELAAALGDDANFATTVTNSLSSKAPLASPTFTGVVTLPSTTSIGNVSSTEIGYLDGVTSAIQTQLDGKEKSIPLQNTAPASPATSDLWVDNTDVAKPVLKVYNGTSWVTAGSSIAADDDQIILASRVFT